MGETNDHIDPAPPGLGGPFRRSEFGSYVPDTPRSVPHDQRGVERQLERLVRRVRARRPWVGSTFQPLLSQPDREIVETALTVFELWVRGELPPAPSYDDGAVVRTVEIVNTASRHLWGLDSETMIDP